MGWVLLLMIVAGSCSATQPQESTPFASVIGKVWMHVDGEWQRPPTDADYPSNYRSAPVTLIRFTNDHEFSLMHCWIIENAKKLTISNGDGQAISIGTWSEDAAQVVAKLHRVYETVQPVGGGKYPGPEERATASVVGHRVRFAGKLFDEAKTLDVRNYEEFIGPERAKLNVAK
jgi:hypothetical protein